MFILIPSLIILFSIVGIVIIVWRRWSYINNYQDSGSALNGLVFHWKIYAADFLPELMELVAKLRLNEHRITWLKELEKFLRRTRLISLKVDRLSEGLIKKVRKIHYNDKIATQKAAGSVPEQAADKADSVPSSSSMSRVFLKNEEERLIMEIAKNPKDGHLYESLGDLYVEMENFTDAKESYEAAIELNPQNESLKLKLSSALEKITPLV